MDRSKVTARRLLPSVSDMASLLCPGMERRVALVAKGAKKSPDQSVEEALIPFYDVANMIALPHDLKDNYDLLSQFINECDWKTPPLHYISAVLWTLGVMVKGLPL
jgi:hypothetical protein